MASGTLWGHRLKDRLTVSRVAMVFQVTVKRIDISLQLGDLANNAPVSGGQFECGSQLVSTDSEGSIKKLFREHRMMATLVHRRHGVEELPPLHLRSRRPLIGPPRVVRLEQV